MVAGNTGVPVRLLDAEAWHDWLVAHRVASSAFQGGRLGGMPATRHADYVRFLAGAQ
jgi:hypothetical protein